MGELFLKSVYLRIHCFL